MNYYEILEVMENASEEVIHMAYKALVKKYHPDVYIGDKKYAEEKMKQINEAYDILSDPLKRKDYDEKNSSSKKNEKDVKGQYYQKSQQEGNTKENYSDKDTKKNQDSSNGFYYKETNNSTATEDEKGSNITFILKWKFVFVMLVLTILFESKVLFFISLTMVIIRYFLGKNNPNVQLHGSDRAIAFVFCGLALIGSMSVFQSKDSSFLGENGNESETEVKDSRAVVSDVDEILSQLTPVAMRTPIPEVTKTPIPTATNIPVPTATSTPALTATNTPVSTVTSTLVLTATSTPVPTETSTPVPTETSTPVPTVTSTPVPTATSTPVPTATSTPVPTATCTPTPTPFVKIGDVVCMGEYEQNNETSSKEAIEWVVLDIKDGKALLYSIYGLELLKYHQYDEGITWENCSLRKWLNSDFYEQAFSEDEKAAIREVVNIDADNEEGDTYGGNDTEDKVFLLSADEAVYYYQWIGNEIPMTKYVSVKDKERVFWHTWLRSLKMQNTAHCITYDPYTGTAGNNITKEGVVNPSVWVEIVEMDAWNKEEVVAQTLEVLGNDIKAGDVVLFGNFEQDDEFVNGKEAIEWLVLDVDNGKALLLSKYCLKKMKSSNSAEVIWEDSDIRKWLNEEFYHIAFSDDEKRQIVSTAIYTTDYSKYGSDREVNEKVKDTEDMLFILSIEEANAYFEHHLDMIASYTMAAENWLPSREMWYGYEACPWWLRNSYNKYTMCVYLNGSIDSTGAWNDSLYGVRPAMWIDISAQ